METKILVNSEWAAAVYSEMDPLKINESPKHTCVSSNSFPVAQVENGPRAHFQNFKLLLLVWVLSVTNSIKVVSINSTLHTTHSHESIRSSYLVCSYSSADSRSWDIKAAVEY